VFSAAHCELVAVFKDVLNAAQFGRPNATNETKQPSTIVDSQAIEGGAPLRGISGEHGDRINYESPQKKLLRVMIDANCNRLDRFLKVTLFRIDKE
jgi:hypothetical protein